MLDAALFMRAPKNSDQNVLTAVKKCNSNSNEVLQVSSPASSSTETALVSITIHNRLSWGHNLLSRSSQHAFLASQTLGELFEAIPCTSNEIPEERLLDGELAGYEEKRADTGSAGCVICVENKAYGDGMSENDYAE